MPTPITAASGKPRHTGSVDLEATIKIDMAKRAGSATGPVRAVRPNLQPSAAPGAAVPERRVSPQRAEFGQRMAILMEQEALAREAERSRTRRWLIGGTAFMVGVIALPLMFSAISGKKSAAPTKPGTERTAPAKQPPR